MPDKPKKKKDKCLLQGGKGNHLISCVEESKDHMNQNWNQIH